MIALSVISRHSAAARRPSVAQRAVDDARELGLESWRGDRLTRSRSRGRPRGAPVGGLAAGLVEHPVADRDDQAGLLGDRDEARGADQAARRVLPAQQRLDADDAAVSRARPRLVEQLAARRRASASRSAASSSSRSSARARSASSKNSQRALPCSLARYMAASASRSSVLGVACVPSPTTRCRCWRSRSAARPSSSSGAAARAACGRRSRARRRAVDVARAGSRTRRRRSGRPCRSGRSARPQPLGDGDQQPVAGAVAERVVDDLEVVEVDEEHREPGRWLARRASASRSGRSNSVRFGRPVSASWWAW